MAEEFEGDLTGAVFWGADLSGATFRDVNLTGTTMKSVWLIGVDIDGVVDRLVVNGVDVTDFVNAHDPWQPLRGMLRPADVAGMKATLAELEREWGATIDQANQLTDAQRRESVDGEWSFVQTLRHLVFAVDKWFTVPLDGGEYDAIGMPNSGSASLPWPGVDPHADPTYEQVLGVRADRGRRLAAYLDTIADGDLDREVDVTENGVVPLRECFYTVFEEQFEHRRYAIRDLARLT